MMFVSLRVMTGIMRIFEEAGVCAEMREGACENENPWSSNNTNLCRPQIIWMATCLKYVKIPGA